jgi:hypothetical protein
MKLNRKQLFNSHIRSLRRLMAKHLHPRARGNATRWLNKAERFIEAGDFALAIKEIDKVRNWMLNEGVRYDNNAR